MADDRRERAREVWRRLGRAVPHPEIELRYENPWQLLVATILSAQSTDETVNRVTPELFARYPTPEKLGRARQESVEQLVASTGFYRNKARFLRLASRAIADEHGGEVPRTLEALIELPGVARKTANVVLGSAYGIASGVVVDTHVGRVSRRLGLSGETKPEKIERDLCALFPRSAWIDLGHRLLLHGRYLCTARKPDCAHCPLGELCPSAEAAPGGDWAERAAVEAERIGAA